MLTRAPSSFRVYFVRACACVLALSAVGKLISVALPTPILTRPDPVIYPLQVWHVAAVAALLEAFAGVWLLRNAHHKFAPGVILWLCSLFIAYRIGLVVISPGAPCPCLGRLAGWLPFPEQTTDRGLLAILAGMTAGSLAVAVSGSARNVKASADTQRQ